MYIPHKALVINACHDVTVMQARKLIELIERQDDPRLTVVIESRNGFDGDETQYNIFAQDTYAYNPVSDYGGIIKDPPYGMCAILTENDSLFLMGILVTKASLV